MVYSASHQDIQLITAVSPDYIWLFRLPLCSIAKETMWGNGVLVSLIALFPSSVKIQSVLYVSTPSDHDVVKVTTVKV